MGIWSCLKGVATIKPMTHLNSAKGILAVLQVG